MMAYVKVKRGLIGGIPKAFFNKSMEVAERFCLGLKKMI